MTPWMDAVYHLRNMGYSLATHDEKLRYEYQGRNNPQSEQIKPLLNILKAHKEEILKAPCFLIEQTLEEINQEWQPKTLEWIKANRGDEWAKILTLEGEINRMPLCGDLDGLRGALNSYRGLIIAMVKEFNSLKENKEQGMFNIDS